MAMGMDSHTERKRRHSGGFSLVAAAATLVTTFVAFSQFSSRIVSRDVPPITLERLGSYSIGLLYEDDRAAMAQFLSISRLELDQLLGITPDLEQAWKDLEGGNLQWKAGNRATAVSLWKSVSQAHPDSNVAFFAMFNVAGGFRLVGERNLAVNSYLAILESSHDENSRHKACLELSDMFLESRNVPAGLEYAELALNVHRIKDWCLYYVGSVEYAIERRITGLRQALSQNRRVELK